MTRARLLKTTSPYPPAVALRLLFCTIGLLAIPRGSSAQDCLPAMPSAHAPLYSELLRAREISRPATPNRTILRTSDDLVRCPSHWHAAGSAALGPLSVSIAPTDVASTLNTGYPDDRNNGTMWAGRGVSSAVQTGLLARLGWLSAGFRPVVTFQQNGEFRVGSSPNATHEYATPLYPGRVDLPYRFGDDAFGTVNVAGQSFVRLDAFGLAIGASSENFWVGPAIRNPILMSNTAPGFPHAFVGTSRPLDIWVGDLEFEVVLGQVRESEYWDSIPDNDDGNVAMWVLGLRPRGLKGLELGGARVLAYRAPGAQWYGESDQLRDFFFVGGPANIEGNELASVFLRWVLEESSAEFYGEWARDDTWANITDDLLPEIDHSQAYMIGFQKLAPLRPDTDLRIHAELSHLQEKVEPRTDRPLPVFYLHHQGGHYTHRGQLMGSGIGLGADAQYIAVDAVHERGFAGVFFERVRRHEGTQRSLVARAEPPFDHDTELTAGVRGLLSYRDFFAGAAVSYSKRWNREFVEDDSNFRIVAELSWRPDPVRAP